MKKPDIKELIFIYGQGAMRTIMKIEWEKININTPQDIILCLKSENNNLKSRRYQNDSSLF